MKHLKYLVVLVLAALILLPVLSACAPTPSPTPTPTPGLTPTPAKPGLPEVPITYAADTDATIIRRAEWIEGAKKEGRLMWWSVFRVAWCNEVIAEFNKVYPFIKVDYWLGIGEEVGIKREAEYLAGRFTVDILQGGEPYNYPRWREMGMMAKWIDIIPGIEKMDKRLYGKDGDWFSESGTVIMPQYNTNLVSAAEAPKNWEDLLDPKWKGQIGITTDMKCWTTLALAEGGWGVAKTEDFLSKLREQDLIWGRGHTATHSLMTSGEFKVHAESYIHHAFASQAKGAPAEWVRANPISHTVGPCWQIQKGAPHPNAAKLFMEWLLSPQGLVIWEKVTGKSPPFPGFKGRIAEAVGGMNIASQTEEAVLEATELGLYQRFAEILGIQ